VAVRRNSRREHLPSVRDFFICSTPGCTLLVVFSLFSVVITLPPLGNDWLSGKKKGGQLKVVRLELKKNYHSAFHLNYIN